ncbi:RDD family protein [Ancylomarina longa]|uniref:RDD family protein n=1 Tax=Ancylomarina longa TaxID=2487017 RepID=A0A434AES4_9BACT|nr:RDD family protein [Ancylomarina longa]RUT72838.1 RDD family protein [Ancylomarina longa]
MDKKLRPSIFKRMLALFVDFLILGIIGYISGLFFEDFYVSLGKYGTLLGSTITIVYFSILQSSIGNGQTIGKKTIGAKVTDLKGGYLTLEKSFLRSFIVFFPIMNVQLFSGGNKMLIIVMLLVLTIMASVYFILVNKSRRCLHDILVASIVTKQDVTDIEIDEQNDRSTMKLIPLGLIVILMIGMGIYQTFTENTISQLLAAKEKIENKNGVIAVNEVKSSTTTYTSTNKPSRTYSSIQISVRIDDKNEASNIESKYFEDIYEIVKNEIPASQEMDGVTMTLYYGYNIGIASKTQSVTKTIEKGND